MAAFPYTQRIGSATGLVVVNGGLTASVGGILTQYASLAAANANGFISTYGGADIVLSDDSRYYRNQAASAWILYYGSNNFSVGNLSPLFTASIVNPTTAPVLTFALSNAAPGTVLNNSTSLLGGPSYTSYMILGETGATAGLITLRSATVGSGESVIRVVGATASYFFNLPLSAGTAGQALLSGGGGTNPHTYGTVLTSITANNGLTTSTATNVQLGGTLIQSTTIATVSFLLTISTATAAAQPLVVQSTTGKVASFLNTSNATNAVTISNGGTGNVLEVNGAGGTGIVIQTSGTAVGINSIVSGAGIAGSFLNGSTATNTIVPVMNVMRGISGSEANGIGGSIDLYATTGGTPDIANRLIWKWTTVTFATRTSEFSIAGYSSGTQETLLAISGNGSTRLNKYGVGAFTGTAAYLMGIDASGNLIEVSPAGSGQAGTYTPTLTNASNVSSSSAFSCQYLSVTDASTGQQVVTVSGKFTLTFTTGGSTTRLGISLPIASSLGTDYAVGGTAGSNSLTNGSFAIRGDAANARAEFYATAPGSGTTETYWFSFTYAVFAG